MKRNTIFLASFASLLILVLSLSSCLKMDAKHLIGTWYSTGIDMNVQTSDTAASRVIADYYKLNYSNDGLELTFNTNETYTAYYSTHPDMGSMLGNYKAKNTTLTSKSGFYGQKDLPFSATTKKLKIYSDITNQFTAAYMRSLGVQNADSVKVQSIVQCDNYKK